jgi:hypothetical protein
MNIVFFEENMFLQKKRTRLLVDGSVTMETWKLKRKCSNVLLFLISLHPTCLFPSGTRRKTEKIALT